MGLDESKIERESSEEESGESGEVDLVRCPDCYTKGEDEEKVVATYRCRLALENMGDIHKYPKLLQYWNPPHMTEDGLYHILYVACDNCILEELKDVFTAYPDGWTQTSHEKVMYELANIEEA